METTVLNRQRGRQVGAASLERFLRKLVREMPPRSKDVAMALCLISDRRMRDYNRRFRGRDASTDVLTFRGDGEADPSGETWLGDIVISVPTAARQARLQGHSLARELRVLAVHGYLHLLGYDHESDDGTMMRQQRRLVSRLLSRSDSRRRG